MTLGGGDGDKDGKEEKERAGNRSKSLQSRVIMVTRFGGICTVTSLCTPTPHPFRVSAGTGERCKHT